MAGPEILGLIAQNQFHGLKNNAGIPPPIMELG